jgi:cytochrome b involved in lipid metabolism
VAVPVPVPVPGSRYHNFHHEVPGDYRNGVRWFQYDPTKWFIWGCQKLGLAYDLKRFPRNGVCVWVCARVYVCLCLRASQGAILPPRPPLPLALVGSSPPTPHPSPMPPTPNPTSLTPSPLDGFRSPSLSRPAATPAEILKGALIMREKALLRDKAKVSWAPATETLPLFTRAEVATQVRPAHHRPHVPPPPPLLHPPAHCAFARTSAVATTPMSPRPSSASAPSTRPLCIGTHECSGVSLRITHTPTRTGVEG